MRGVVGCVSSAKKEVKAQTKNESNVFDLPACLLRHESMPPTPRAAHHQDQKKIRAILFEEPTTVLRCDVLPRT